MTGMRWDALENRSDGARASVWFLLTPFVEDVKVIGDEGGRSMS